MELRLKQEYIDSDVILTFTEKGQQWHYTIKRVKPHQYQRLYDNGYQHLFDIVNNEDMPLFETETSDEEQKPSGLVDYTSYKKKRTVTVKKDDNI